MRSILLMVCALVICTIKVTVENTCGGNCPSGTCTSCPCGTTPSNTSISAACSQYQGWSQDCCECIVLSGSGGNLNAMSYYLLQRAYQVGLWQINQFYWASCNNGSAPCSETANLNCALQVFQMSGDLWKNFPACGACGQCCYHS